MRAMFGKVRAIDDEHSILLAQRLVHQALVVGQQGLIIPGPFPNELLERAHLSLRIWPHPQQSQGHCFHILPRNISREQPTQIDRRPLALLASVEQRSKVLVVSNQFFGQGSHLFRGQFLHSQSARRRRLVGGDIEHKRHRVPPPGIDFLSVYPTKSRCNTSTQYCVSCSTHIRCYAPTSDKALSIASSCVSTVPAFHSLAKLASSSAALAVATVCSNASRWAWRSGACIRSRRAAAAAHIRVAWV